MAKVGLINYGSGNFMSVFNALKYLNIDVIEVRVPAQLDNTTHIILPGVGAFNALVTKLEALGFVEGLEKHVVTYGKAYLGICVGMQILATLGTEFQDSSGLDYIHGKILKIPAEKYDLRLPHIGWNEVVQEKECPLFSDIDNSASFYFAHSYHFVPNDKDSLVAICCYGENVTACIAKDNCYGVQFHPEKSQNNGLKLLENFIKVS
jgi:imidazole glycerol-phosphate synthase subunit HisH